MKSFLILFIAFLFTSCSTTKIQTSNKPQLTFLDEYILSDTLIMNNTPVGGLSGIDYSNGLYYLVCDDARNPRYYTAKIDLDKNKIKQVSIQNVITIKDTTHYLDLESIRYSKTSNQIYISSEGNIKKHKNPSFFKLSPNGSLDKFLDIPKQFLANSSQKPRHNGVFEGLSNSFDGNGFWLAMELPLEVDGPEPQLIPTDSPVRITYIDGKTEKATKQFGYKLDAVSKKPKKSFYVNGLTDILSYKKDQFLIIERSYSSGLGNQGNTVRIYDVNASKATDILSLNSLKTTKYVPATKTLLLDFEQLRQHLTENSIDNIEGITFGPTLPNGNRSIILISDNNFNTLGKQFNQFILLEMSFKN